MRSDLGRELNEIAPAPRSRLDLGAVWLRAQQLQRRRLLSYGLAMLFLVGGTAAAVTASPFDGNEPGRIGATVRPSDELPEKDPKEELRQLTARLQAELDELSTQLAKTIGKRVSLSNRAARRMDSEVKMRDLQQRIRMLDARASELTKEIGGLRGHLRALLRAIERKF